MLQLLLLTLIENIPQYEIQITTTLCRYYLVCIKQTEPP